MKKYKSLKMYLTLFFFIIDFDDQNLLVLNSFKNITAIVDKSLIGDSQIPDNLAELLDTPNSSNEMEFKRLVDSCSYENIYTAFIIAITYRCNLHCIYCYQQNDKTLSKHIISDENLSLIFETISKYHQDHPNEIIDIGLFGGEPLLPETRDVVKKVMDFCAEKKSKLHIMTNGANLDLFLKSIHPLCKQQNISFNRSELKNLHWYCWASSNIDKVFYIDSDLDTFRCTYTVGRKEFEMFKFNIDNLEKFKLRNRSFWTMSVVKTVKSVGIVPVVVHCRLMRIKKNSVNTN